MEAIVLIIVLLALILASLRWSADSRDGFNSPEWAKRHNWRITNSSSPHN